MGANQSSGTMFGGSSAQQVQAAVIISTVLSGDSLKENQILSTGGRLVSQGGNYVLVMQTDGNLVGYNANQIGSGAWWASNTAGQGNNLIAQMQNDGNFVIYPSNSTGGPPSITPFSGAKWASGSAGKGKGPYRLVMQSDRNIVVYDGNNNPVWASGTNVPNPPPPIQESVNKAAMEVAAYVPQSSKKYWGPQTGIDYPGNDLGNTRNSDPDACATNCDNSPQCVGYVLGTDGPNCWLKSSFQNPTPSSVRTASVKPGQPAPPGLPHPPPVAAAPVAAILAASPPASASQVASCLQTLQSCIAATPDASAPATGTSSYTLEGASFVPVPTSKKILKLFLAFLVVFFAMLMMMKNK